MPPGRHVPPNKRPGSFREGRAARSERATPLRTHRRRFRGFVSAREFAAARGLGSTGTAPTVNNAMQVQSVYVRADRALSAFSEFLSQRRRGYFRSIDSLYFRKVARAKPYRSIFPIPRGAQLRVATNAASDFRGRSEPCASDPSS